MLGSNEEVLELFSVLDILLRNCNLRNLKGQQELAIFTFLHQRAVKFDSLHLHLALDCMSSLVEHLELTSDLFGTIAGVVKLNSSSENPANMVSLLNLIASLSNFAAFDIW